MLHRYLPLVAVLAIAPAPARPPRYAPSTGESALYRCSDGRRVEVLYSQGDVAVLTMSREPMQLDRQEGESEVYAAGGDTWRVTGARTGKLSRGGAAVSCRAG